MTLALLDGLEDTSSFSPGGTTAVVAGRSGNAVRLANLASLRFTVPAAQESDTFTIGVAFQLTATPTSTGAFIALRSDAAVTTHLQIHVQPNGSLQVLRPLTIVLATSAAGLVVPNVWNYLELQAKTHDTTGFFTVRLNGTQVLAATNVDTKNAGTKTGFDTVEFTNGNLGGGTLILFDDVYVKTGAGETFLGDITVETLYPNGNGNASQWVGSDGDSTNNYLLVDEVGAPVTTDYTKSATVGQIDQYTLTDLANSGTILGVCHQATMGLAAAGTQGFQLVNRRTANTFSPTLTVTSTTYAGFHYALTNDPETSAPWTVANVNALQAGVIVASSTDVLLEPFNNLTAWTNSGGTIAAGGRTGTALQITPVNFVRYQVTGAQESDTFTVGFAYFVNGAQSGSNIIQFLGDAGATSHLVLSVSSVGGMSVTRGGASIGSGAPSGTIVTGAWQYVEMQATLHDTTGAFIVRVNGAVVASGTNVDTKNAGTKTVFDSIRLGSGSGGVVPWLFDDLYITVGAGAVFKGSIAIS